MKKRIIIIAVTLIGLVAILVILTAFPTASAATRPVSLVIAGPDGQRFTGSYVADGITNSVSAVAPATISLQAREVGYEFKREGGVGEFRVALFVGDLCRTSTTSHEQPGVRGELRFAAGRESYWAAGF
ncbi:MAG TPA: hypothetical protein P5205_19090 [Candidatus Paceibacterota bacterium]|nr:hypothetical protein [Verrucomicrobiota bacterium]HSA12470.1 hypothetical protein [Candidatus Paceibacterota bacterium]